MRFKPTAFILFLIASAALAPGCRTDSEGKVILADSSYSWTVVGTSNDGFDAPDGLLWKEGALLMADEGGPAVRIWNNAGDVRTLSDADVPIESPEDLVLDTDSTIYFTDDDAGGVWKTGKGGSTSLLAGKEKGLISTEGIALAPDGTILVGDGRQHKIFSVSRSGSVETFIGADYGIKKPESLAFDEKGNLYIADNEDNVLYLLTPDKKLRRLIENRPGFSPESIWYSNGRLLITDSDHWKLFEYDPERGLRTIASFEGVFRKVSGVTTDDRGRIYLSVQTHIDNKHAYILRLDPTKGDG